MAKHVGKTEENLQQRLQDEPNIPVASSFHDEGMAELAISAALDKNEATIAQWLRRPKEPTLPLRFESESSMGIALDRGASRARPSNVATIVLKPDSRGGFYVLTAYLR